MGGECVQRKDREKTTEEHVKDPREEHVGKTAVAEAQKVAAEADKKLDEIDKVLDELEDEGLSGQEFEDLMADIDKILAPNAQKFVAEYHQRGGE